jgi:hypothetical protein
MRNESLLPTASGVHPADPERQTRLRAAAEIFQPQTRGDYVHRAIQEAAIQDAWAHLEAKRIVKGLVPKHLSPIYRQSLVAVMRGAVGAYRTNFLREGWELVGVEVPVGAVRLDLLWSCRAGLVVDEIKLGGSYAYAIPEEDIEQVTRQLAAASEEWGTDFLGVRILPLFQPSRKIWVPRR